MYNSYCNGNMPMIQMSAQPCPYTPMLEEQLEAMYPRTYKIIQPVADSECDKVLGSYGQSYTPTKEQLESMIDNVYTKVEVDIDIAIKQSLNEKERQFFGSGRRLLRDFIGAIIISNLIRRRRRPLPFYPGSFGYPGYYGAPGSFGYPGYY